MLKKFLSLMIIFLSIIMIFITHPLSMGLLILIQTLLLCIISGLMINTYWFSYILFLTFLGGLLVLFIYVSSIASNELFKFSFFNFNFIIIFIIIFFYYYFLVLYVQILIFKQMMNLNFKPLNKTHPIYKIIYNSLINLPTPSNISSFWNFGSLLALCLITQIITGLFLTMYYTANIEMAFSSVNYICRNVNYGWLIRTIYANGASFFFICIYIHIGRGIYYESFNLKYAWMVGVIILFLLMATAFMGYVLPWGQMSFWGATVITNLLSAIPYLGTMLVNWIWGGFAVDNATLTRFYTFHFLLPFIILMMTMIHLLFLHQTGSNNPLGINSNLDKIPFHPFFTFKDLIGFIILIYLFILLTLINPYLLGDTDNFTPANPLVTPIHIQPEWYFLFAYAILRSIPNKLGGVIALLMSILILIILPFSNNKKIQGIQFYPLNQILFWSLISIIFLLTWIGARPVEIPYILTGQLLTILYFSYFFINPFLNKFWDNLIFKFN